MLTGRAKPFAIRDEHERRPQTGGVVAAVTPITQEDLEGAEKTVSYQRGREPIHAWPCRKTHQLWVVWKTTVLAGVIVGR